MMKCIHGIPVDKECLKCATYDSNQNSKIKGLDKYVATLEAKLAGANEEIQKIHHENRQARLDLMHRSERLAKEKAAREKAVAERNWAEQRLAAAMETVLALVPDEVFQDFLHRLPDRARQLQAVVDAAIEETKAEKTAATNFTPVCLEVTQARKKRSVAVAALTKDTTDDG